MQFATKNHSEITGKYHFFVILACIIMQLFDVSSLYRFFAYLNIVVVLLLLPRTFEWKSAQDKKQLAYLFAIPIGFILLDWIAISQPEYTKEIRRIAAATFMGVGIWMLAKYNLKFVEKHLLKITLATIFIYVLIQIIAYWGMGKEFAVYDNPHYLAFYSASLFIVAIEIFFKVPKNIKWQLAIAIAFLGYFILLSQSRPTWIGLIFSGLCLLLYLESALKKRVILIFALLMTVLIVFNIGNFAGRFGDLLLNITTEERATIWRDAWQLQMASTPMQWLTGHGLSLDAYEEAFKTYSQFHLVNNDFNTPHNFILEILYASGVIGLGFSLLLLVKIYQKLLRLIKVKDQYRRLYILLLLVFTTNLITVSITVPFTSIYNLNMIALVIGILMFIKEKHQNSLS